MRKKSAARLLSCLLLFICSPLTVNAARPPADLSCILKVKAYYIHKKFRAQNPTFTSFTFDEEKGAQVTCKAVTSRSWYEVSHLSAPHLWYRDSRGKWTDQLPACPHWSYLYSVWRPEDMEYYDNLPYPEFDAREYRTRKPYQLPPELVESLCAQWNQAGKKANPDTGRKYCLNHQKIGSSVNVANGNLFDAYQVSPDPNFPITINYNSRSRRTGRFGYGWNDSYDIRILPGLAGAVILIDADGREEEFQPGTDGTFAAPPGNHDILATDSTGTYRLSRKNGMVVTFNQEGRPTSVADPNGNTTSYNYDGEILSGITGPAGQILTFTADGNGLLTGITDSAGRSSLFSYDAEGNLTMVTNPAGDSRMFSYDADHNLIRKTDTLGRTTDYAYDDQDRVLRSLAADGKTHQVEYNAPGTTTVSDTADRQTVFIHDDSGRVTEKIDAQNNMTEYGWDADMNLTSIKDAGGTRSYEFDNVGNLLSKTDQDGNTTTYTYDSRGNLLSITDPEGRSLGFTYDQQGNLLSVRDAAGNVTRYQYNARGRITGKIDPTGRNWSYAYDESGNIIKITGPTGAAINLTYDAAGNLNSLADPNGKVSSFEHDILNRLTSITDPLGNQTVFTYDAMGNRLSATDADGNTTTFAYDYQNRVVGIVDALGRTTSFAYSAAGCSACGDNGDGRPATVTDANGRTTTFEYDALGRLSKEARPSANENSYQYDATGNLLAMTDGKGQITRYRYDNLGRLLEKTYPDGTATFFTYDASNNIITAGNQYISYRMAYDLLDRLTEISDSNGMKTVYEYDALGNRTRMITPAGGVVTYAYDLDNRPARIDSWAGSIGFAYDAAGRRTALSLPNGITTSYAYDNAGRLLHLQGVNRKGRLVNFFSYTHDKTGNRLTNAADNWQKSYNYDNAYQILGAALTRNHKNGKYGGKKHEKHESHHAKDKNKREGNGRHAHHGKLRAFSYDPAGNRMNGPQDKDVYLYNEENQLTYDRRHYYQYDENGNLVRKIRLDEDGEIRHETTYGYDYENRLTKITKNGHDESTTVGFKYDPFGRRIEKMVEKYGDGKIKVNIFTYVYDNEDIILEIRTKPHGGKEKTQKISYLHGPGLDEPLAIEEKGRIYFYHADGLGSIVALSDKKGHTVQTYDYSPFGTLKRHGNKIKNHYTFTGREWDRETGLYYYRARYYDPKTGRFITEDPLGFASGTTNLYSYVGNNPLNWVDPWGLSWRSVVLGGTSTALNTAALATVWNPPLAATFKTLGGAATLLTLGNAYYEYKTGQISKNNLALTALETAGQLIGGKLTSKAFGVAGEAFFNGIARTSDVFGTALDAIQTFAPTPGGGTCK